MSNFFDRFSLSGKKSLVTGASKGIGEVIAKVLAEAGSDLVIVGRDKDGLNKTQQFIKKLGRDCLIINSDLSQKEGPEKTLVKGVRSGRNWKDIFVTKTFEFLIKISLGLVLKL